MNEKPGQLKSIKHACRHKRSRDHEPSNIVKISRQSLDPQQSKRSKASSTFETVQTIDGEAIKISGRVKEAEPIRITNC